MIQRTITWLGSFARNHTLGKPTMRLLILTQYFAPEVGAPQTRLLAMANELRRLGHDVEVVTAMPNYPEGHIFNGYRRSIYRREVRDGITIRRVWLYAALGGGFKRILNYASFAITCIFGLLLSRKPDYIFIESPSLLLSLPGYVFSRIWGVHFILNVADLWPDSVREKGFLKKGFLIDLISWLERWSYKKAAYVNAMTEGMRESLLRDKAVPAEKVLFLPNGVDTVLYCPRPEDTGLKIRLGLEGKKIILYAGTQGHAHALEHVLYAAKLLESQPEIHFLFLGNGSARLGLEHLHKELKLRNVTFLNPVPLDQLPPYFSIAECGLSSLRDLPLFDGARPAKVFPILASGKPLIFVGRGEGALLVQRANAGIVVPPADPQALVESVLRLTADPALALELGRNGREFVEANLQWSNLVGEWLERLADADCRREVAANAVRP
jgi:colanic acid biosynthesis glycosyl transferase WcaI